MRQPFLFKKDAMFQDVLDFSFLLDAPAGKHGFVTIKDGHFHLGNGRIRFYGFNISFDNLFMPKEDAVVVAERLAKAGVNFVRLHAPDSVPFHGKPLMIDYTKGNSTNFDPVQMDKLDWLFHCLKEKGIYMQLDLLVRRGYLPDDDLDYPDDLMQAHKGANVFNRRLVALQKEYADRYLLRVNPYTGMRYVDDPAVVTVQVMNENSIFWDDGIRGNGTGLPSYNRELDRRFNHWLLAKYGSRKWLDEAWTKEDGTRALLEEEDPEQGTVQRLRHLEGTQMYVDWQADYNGLLSPARYADYTEFLTHIQLDFAREMRTHLLHLGVKCPISISNHAQGAADIYSLDRYADLNQNNAYWNHPDPMRTDAKVFHGMNIVETDPRQTVVDSPFKLNLLTRLNHNRVAGKPFVAAEWNILYGTDFRSDALPMVAAYASLQDWDGMVLYAYHHAGALSDYDDTKLDGPFDLYNDPAVWGQIGLCSYLFQKGLVQAGRNRLEVAYSEQDLYAVPRNWIAPYGCASFVSQIAATFPNLAYHGDADMVLSSGHTPTGELKSARHALIWSRSPYVDGAQQYSDLDAWLHKHRQSGATFEVLPDGNLMDADYRNFSRILDAAMKRAGMLYGEQGLSRDETQLASDTDELIFNYGKGVFQVNAPCLKLASGNIQGTVRLGRYELQVYNPKMTLTLLSLDGKDTDESDHLLMTALGWCGNEGMLFTQEPDGSRILTEVGNGPVTIDALEGVLNSSETLGQIQIYPLTAEGKRMTPLAAGETVRFEGQATMYYEWVRELP